MLEDLINTIVAVLFIAAIAIVGAWFISKGLESILGVKVALWPIIMIQIGCSIFRGITGGTN